MARSINKGIAILIAAVICVCTAVLILLSTRDSIAVYPTPTQESAEEVVHIPSGPYVNINGTFVSVALATSSSDVQKGLSGRETLPANNGMLFLFKKKEVLSFWMPDMHFPLDMIWIDDNQVLDITHNATNIFDEKNPVFYRPRVPVRYVLEVNAGFAKEKGIEIGDPVTFNNLQ